jgi:hypothetical protein
MNDSIHTASGDTRTATGHSGGYYEPREEERKTLKFLSVGSSGEAVAGGAAVVLAILGLVDVLPMYMVSIAAICAGAAMFQEGTAIAAQYRQLEEQINGSEKKTKVALGGGMGFQVLGGIAGIVLGILALVGVASVILVAVAVIAMGGSLLLGAGATERLDKARTEWGLPQYSKSQWIRDSILDAAGLQVLAGLAAVTLGIIALSGVAPIILVLVAELSIGAAVLFAGAAVAAEATTALKH